MAPARKFGVTNRAWLADALASRDSVRQKQQQEALPPGETSHEIADLRHAGHRISRCSPSAIAATWSPPSAAPAASACWAPPSHSPETVERELKWIDDHVDGKPYGIDVLIPENISTAGEKDVTWKSLEARISPEHRDFTRNLLKNTASS